ncbi:hypothetical protein D3C71_2055280 [compost metagenome]
MEARESSDTQSRQRRLAHALAITEQGIAFGFNLDALAFGVAINPGLRMTMKTKAQPIMSLQVIQGFRLTVSCDVRR